MFQTKAVEKVKTHILCSVTFFRKLCLLWGNVERMWKGETGHRWQCNMAHALCALDDKCHRHTLRTCNNYCFSTV